MKGKPSRPAPTGLFGLPSPAKSGSKAFGPEELGQQAHAEKPASHEIAVAFTLIAPFVLVYGVLFVYPTIEMVGR